MATLRQQTMDWARTAPFQASGHARSTAPPEVVFAVLAEHDRWPEWFPNVKEVTVLGSAEGVGARRRVRVPGLTVDEEFIEWEPGRRFAFTGTDAKPAVFTSLVEHCALEPTDDGGTDITWTMCAAPRPVVGLLMKVAKGQVGKVLQRGMAGLAARAESAAGANGS